MAARGTLNEPQRLADPAPTVNRVFEKSCEKILLLFESCESGVRPPASNPVNAGFISVITPVHTLNHDRDIDLHSTVAPQYAGKHRHPLLGENVGMVPPSAALL